MKRAKQISISIIGMILVGTITFYIGRQIGLNTDTSSETTVVEEVTVGTQTIKKTLTSSGEIQSANTEKLTLSTSYYFETMCVEEDDIVKEGENILKYTNGTYLTAPYDLIVTSYSIPETQTKATSSHYIQVQDLENLVIQLSVSESEINEISLGQQVEIVLTADTTKEYTGEITKITSVGTYQASGTTFPVEVSFANDGDIKIGMSASCTITIEELTDVLAVPIAGVQVENDRKYVVVVENGQTKEVDIETGLSNDEYVEITSGLNGGETIQVVTSTKQNTIRNSTENENTGGRGEMNFSGGRQSMPGGMNGGEMPSGGNLGGSFGQ